jgi:hypothetical protein
VTKKFGTGILASGFKRISVGVFIIAGGIIIDAIQSYIAQAPFLANFQTVVYGIILAKDVMFVLGTYVIVIGSKSTGDKLENLTK